MANDGSYYDADKLAALLRQVQPGADGRTVLGNDAWMQLLNPLSGLKQSQAATSGQLVHGSNDEMTMSDPTSAIYKDAQGRSYKDVGNGNIQYTDNSGGGWQNPTGTDKDRVQPTYHLNADGTATPVDSGASYKPSMWISSGRDAAKILGTVLAAGAGGAALAGAGAGGSGTAAAGATAAGGTGAQSSATLAALYGEGGYGAATAGEAGFAGLGGTTAGGAAGLTAAETAALPGAYGTTGAYGGVGTAGAGAAGEGAAPSLWDSLVSKAGDMASNPKTYTDLLKAYTSSQGGAAAGGAGGGAGGNNITLGDNGAAASELARQKARQAMLSFNPTWSGPKQAGVA